MYDYTCKQPYYLDQSAWGIKEYYTLNRYLNKLFLQSEKRMNEITEIDFDRLTEITRVLFRIQFSRKRLEHLMDTVANLEKFKDVQPLSEPLYLRRPPIDDKQVYLDFNVRSIP